MKEKKATKVTGCNTCKKGLSNTQKSTLFIGMYIIATSIYGTVSLINHLIGVFK
jgi:hypothetical protein